MSNCNCMSKARELTMPYNMPCGHLTECSVHAWTCMEHMHCLHAPESTPVSSLNLECLLFRCSNSNVVFRQTPKTSFTTHVTAGPSLPDRPIGSSLYIWSWAARHCSASSCISSCNLEEELLMKQHGVSWITSSISSWITK